MEPSRVQLQEDKVVQFDMPRMQRSRRSSRSEEERFLGKSRSSARFR